MRIFFGILSAILLSFKEGLATASSSTDNVPEELREYFALVNRVRRHAIQTLHGYPQGACDLSDGALLLSEWLHYRENHPLDALQIEAALVEYAKSCHVRVIDELFHNFGLDMVTCFNNQNLAGKRARLQNRIDKLVHEQNQVSLQIGVEQRRLECFESIRSLVASKSSSSSVVLSGSTCTFLASSRPASGSSELSQILGMLKTQTEVDQINTAFGAAVEYVETFHRTNPYVVSCLRNALDPKPVEDAISYLRSFYHRLQLDLSQLLRGEYFV